MAGFIERRVLGISSASKIARVYLAEFETEKDVEVNTVCKHFPTTSKRNVFQHDISVQPHLLG